MTSKLTRERIELIANFHRAMVLPPSHDEIEELARIALAAMDSEPVGEFYEEGPLNWYQISDGDRVPASRRIPLYRHAQPAPVNKQEPIAWLNDAYLARGVVDGEAGSEDAGPGYIPVYREQATQPAPVMSDEILSAMEEVLRISDREHEAWHRAKAGISACRAAMLQAGNSPVIPGCDGAELMPSTGEVIKLNPANNKLYTTQPAVLVNSPVIGIDLASGPDRSVEVRYVSPPGYVMVPAKANIAMIRAGGKAAREYQEEHGGNSPQVIYQAMLAAAPQEVK
ncbi:hypothetical protein [Klebsiella michiganensis]|uniref:hypothetical protein n=1 Tax=Klebsiella michiganensis TaxID=1134687 RepID=UPI00069FED50|nr:hypothetical protein [Klebsiella michiganensis]ELO7626980.1 hypothetical protein [Klebsiella michiganensis]DAF66434.1 MAG TPA: hypothetical protein [Caudoviricetes sp.]